MDTLTGAVLTVLAVALWGVIHSLLASPRTKERIRDKFGASVDRGYRLFYNAVAGITLLPVLLVPAALPGQTLYQISAPWLYLTTVIQLLAVLAIVVSLLQTGASSFLGFRQLLQSEEPGPARLNVGGLYRWVRHPLYTAGLAFIWLSPVMTTSTLALYVGFTLYILIGSRYEERQLAAEFGEAYEEYRSRVPAIVPRPWRHY